MNRITIHFETKVNTGDYCSIGLNAMVTCVTGTASDIDASVRYLSKAVKDAVVQSVRDSLPANWSQVPAPAQKWLLTMGYNPELDFGYEGQRSFTVGKKQNW